MNNIVVFFLLAICAYVESGYIDFGPGYCGDSEGQPYDRYTSPDAVSSPEQCLHDNCIVTPSFVGVQFETVYAGDPICNCLYKKDTDGNPALPLGLDPSITFDGTFGGKGPISKLNYVDGDRCHKYIDENGLEFHRDFDFNSSAASFTLSAEVGEFYTNLSSTDQYRTEMTLYGWDASATQINETLCGSDATTKLTPDRAKAISNLEPLTEPAASEIASSTTFTQEFSLNLTDIATSDLYVSTSDTEGKIIFCARMDIMDITNETNKKSTFFAETFLTLLVNMTADFTLASVTAERFDPTEQDAEASFDVDACLCDSDGACSDEVVSQNSDFNVCIRSKSNGVVVETVKEMAIYQDDEKKFNPVSDEERNALTEIDTSNENYVIVTTRAISSLFNKVPPSPLRITGSVGLGFVSARRLLEENVFATGEEDDETPTASFELSVGLKPLTDDTEEIATSEGEDEGEEEDVVFEENEDDEGIANKEKSGSSVQVNVIVGVVGAVVCSLILAVGLRRAGSRSGTGVGVEYDGLKGTV